MRHILSSAVITAPGDYTYALISLIEAIQWLEDGEWQSSIGYRETAEALSELTGIEVPYDRRTIVMRPGDEALVFRLVLPPGSRRIEPLAKAGLGRDYILANCEIGLLRRTA